MATDKSEPRVGLIIKVGLVTIAMLGIVRGVLGSYFNEETAAERYRKFGQIRPDALLSLRADEKERLTAGPMPIERAMAEEARAGRKSMMPALMPTASRDVAPLQGWLKMPADVPSAMMAPPPEPVPVVVVGDAGASVGSHSPHAAGDAGAAVDANGRKKKP